MNVPLLDLKAQFAPIADEIRDAIDRVVRSQIFVLGEEVSSLEDEVAAYTGATHAIGCASGTDALILSLAALDFWLLQRRPIDAPLVRLIGWLASLIGIVTLKLR